MASPLSWQWDNVLNRLVENGLLRESDAPESVPGGSINTVFRVRTVAGERAVLRIGPSRTEVSAGPSWMRAEALACEAIVLDRVRPAIHRVPVPIAAGFRDAERPWLLQTVLPGEPLPDVLLRMTVGERRRVWRDLGQLTRRLHALLGARFGTPDGRHRFPDWAGMVRADAIGLLADARRFGLDAARFEQLVRDVDRHADALNLVSAPSIVHSDLDPRHIFVRETGSGWEISGVIDWEYARYADPLSESLIVDLLIRPPDDPDRVAFLAGYGLDAAALDDPAFQARQSIYRGIAAGWALTDAARLREGLVK